MSTIAMSPVEGLANRAASEIFSYDIRMHGSLFPHEPSGQLNHELVGTGEYASDVNHRLVSILIRDPMIHEPNEGRSGRTRHATHTVEEDVLFKLGVCVNGEEALHGGLGRRM